MGRFFTVFLLISLALAVAGCPKGGQEYKAGKKAEALEDYDTALVHFERALRANPQSIEYRLKATRMRFEAGQAHVTRGQKLRDEGELQLALAAFQRALAIDPASAIAGQEIRGTLDLLSVALAPPPDPLRPEPEPEPSRLLERPPQLKPLDRSPINLKITNDARIVFETIGRLAGIGVVFDPEFSPRRIPVELTNVTLEQALDVVALMSRTFWQPVAPNIIFVSPDSPQKRKDYEEYVVRTFYLSNTLTPQDLTEIATGLRQVLEMRRIQPVNAQNALIIRDTPDKIAVAEHILNAIDKAKPEVVIQVSVLQARRDRARDLGITPGASSVLSFTPRNPTGEGTTQAGQIRLNELQRLSTADYSITLPGASATALVTDSTTRIIQNPEIRIVDGQTAKLRVGDRVPVATGSFQAGVGIGGVTGTATGIVNPLVNTQFQFQDVGVNIDITPRIHANREVSMKVAIEVSSVTGRVNIGGIEQPIFSQRKIEHDVRLTEGEVNILGGLIERSETQSIQGWPGLSRIPFLRYFFSGERTESLESEVLIVLTPRIVRLPEFTPENLRGLATGTDGVFRVRPEDAYLPAPAPQQQPIERPAPAPVPPAADPQPRQPIAAEPGAARLRFDPEQATARPGETLVIGVVVENARDLFSIPLMVQYDPAVLAVEEVRHGGFLGAGTQEVAIVQRIDAERGQATVSAMRQPNTPGVSGTGTVVGLVVRALAPGSSPLRIVQVNARDSQQRTLPMVSGEAVVRVQ
jgi:general secretion pathway protein D